VLLEGDPCHALDLVAGEVRAQREAAHDVDVRASPKHADILADVTRSRAVLEFFSVRVSNALRRRDVPELIDALRSGRPRTRRAAANALIEIPDPRAIDSLVRALHDPDVLVRVNAAIALGEFQGRPELDAIIEPLSTAMHDESPIVRAMAASALGRVKDPSSVPALVQALDDRDASVRGTVSFVLRTFDDPRAAEALEAHGRSS
jgi:HEAT repeat protein